MSSAAIAIDAGSGLIKAGFAGDDAPKAVFPAIVGHAKETLSYVASDYQHALHGDRNHKKETYRLPDGSDITIDTERFQCQELLFNPKLNGVEGLGISELAFRAIQKCDIDIRRDLYANIVLSG